MADPKVVHDEYTHLKPGPWQPGSAGAWAICRFQVEGDWAAATLLYWLKWRWRKPGKKLIRKNKEWIAASATEWARECGLSPYEFRDRAVRRLKEYPFVEIQSYKLKGKKSMWMRLIPEMLPNQITGDYEFYDLKREACWRALGGNKMPKIKAKQNPD